MASIFTYDPNPKRVSSPWLSTSGASSPGSAMGQAGAARVGLDIGRGVRQDSSLTRLEAEPQEGPTEYKLHLLLRPRRSFTTLSTTHKVSGSYRTSLASVTPRSISEFNLNRASPPPASSNTGKQHRLEQLTTQLLWRLQQSSPYHSTASHNPVLPILPDTAGELHVPSKTARLLPGLEDSKGALYEIGVADDGTFVGLAEDEMEESLNNLRAMAASLGCTVEVTRQVKVGTCKWLEASMSDHSQVSKRSGTLWVVEAFVKPNIESSKPHEWSHMALFSNPPRTRFPSEDETTAEAHTSPTEQLRLSFTGTTMSGKSSLLGTLSTTTLDNGRGKSRLSLLKHGHERASGMTSSVTQELVGYCDVKDDTGCAESTRVINYASGNVSSWTDIHESSQPGRVAFLSDSAGHPRYRRTTVRGLIGWAPHWTLLCVPADNTEDTAGRSGSTPPPQELLGPAAANIDLSDAHLQLCLDLGLPLAVVITKLDLASTNGLRQTMSRLLTTLKAAGRAPLVLPASKLAVAEEDLSSIVAIEMAQMKDKLDTLNADPVHTIPIILTSAITGAGISSLHALIRQLPIPATPVKDAHPSSLFHVEDVYRSSNDEHAQVTVVSGHLKYGDISLSDELLIGPFPDESLVPGDLTSSITAPERLPLSTARSYPGALTSPQSKSLRAQSPHEWRLVKVVSIRNLRLPVRTLQTGQVGTIGLCPVSMSSSPLSAPSLARLRKGMALSAGVPKARRGFVARFSRHQVRDVLVGTAVVVYFASVRASARLISIAVEEEDLAGTPMSPVFDRTTSFSNDDGGFSFGFEGDGSEEEEVDQEGPTLVTFRFVASKEYVEVGAQVLMMPGGGPGLIGGTERGEKGIAGLDGFVGEVVGVFE